MKIFSFSNRSGQTPSTPVPHLRVPVAHLAGPGKLRRQDDHLIFESEQTKQIRLDVEGLLEIVAYGEVDLSTNAMRLLNENHIAFSWLHANGCYVSGRLTHDHSDRTLVRLLQFKAWEDHRWQLTQAQAIVRAKVESMHGAIRHYQRQGKQLPKSGLTQFEKQLEAIPATQDLATLRGIEGHTAASWFRLWGELFPKEWKFKNRNRRPPKDPVNALLSFGYMHLYRRVAARIEARGLDPSLGALHEYRSGRLSMACDLMEPLRIPVVDRLVYALCAQRIVIPAHFEPSARGGVQLKKEHLGKVVARLEEHWKQSHFEQMVDTSLYQWVDSTRQNVSEKTGRAANYLKSQAIGNSRDNETNDDWL